MRFIVLSVFLVTLISCSQNVSDTKNTTENKPMTTDKQKTVAAEQKIDHLIYVVPDLEKGIDDMETLLGIRAVMGGSHPGIGTRNAMIALSENTYMELFAPDPAQIEYFKPRPFGMDDLDGPKLVGWAAKGTDLAKLSALSLTNELSLGKVMDAHRKTAEGKDLNWNFTNPRIVLGDGLVPFFINWGKSEHPAVAAAKGAKLIKLRAEHPNPKLISTLAAELGVELSVSKGDAPMLIATLDSPNGIIELK